MKKCSVSYIFFFLLHATVTTFTYLGKFCQRWNHYGTARFSWETEEHIRSRSKINTISISGFFSQKMVLPHFSNGSRLLRHEGCKLDKNGRQIRNLRPPNCLEVDCNIRGWSLMLSLRVCILGTVKYFKLELTFFLKTLNSILIL